MLIADDDRDGALTLSTLLELEGYEVRTVHGGQEALDVARDFAVQHQIYVVLKGYRTLIATPDGKVFISPLGNPGMATAGSGDVLTGILTGLAAQGYSSIEACVLGVYLHGLAGDFAAKNISEEAMIAGDITSFLGEAFLSIS